jgi:hypothetical protein
MQVFLHVQLSLQFGQVVRFVLFDGYRFGVDLELRDGALFEIGQDVVFQLGNVDVSCLQLLLCLLELCLQFGHGQFFVYFGSVFNLLGGDTETEGGNCFRDVVGMRGAGHDQTGFGVTPQGLLQHTGQLAVAVGDVCRFAISQGVDDLAQGSQTSVDFLSLIQYLPLRPRLGYLLAAGQIDQIEFACLGAEVLGVVLADGEYEDHVGAGGAFVHVGGCDGPEVACSLDDLVYFFWRRDVFFS